ncbi:sugar O-acetyltransferase [Methanolapillus millepedarum]|uniref:Acetyltransferase n=1 Tax=Methanolapillus millepedarum TaxID=3028296 RepID=A0AA96ZUB0_9EURY|nr:Putative acetyltransferase [Methanosarcinaceae archaeon Ac7]
MTNLENENDFLYYSGGEKLDKERADAKGLCHEYNQLHPSKMEERNAILRKLFGKTKNKFLIEQPFYCDYGYNIEIGENFYMNHGGIILDCAKVTFGDNVFVAPDCGFYTVGHATDKEERNKGMIYSHPICVGNDVWIGGRVIVLPGVTIGNGVIIGAGSVVTKDIPDNVIAYGNPCRVVRKI